MSLDRAVLPGSWIATGMVGAAALLGALLFDAGERITFFSPGGLAFLAWLALNFGVAALLRGRSERVAEAVREGALYYGLFSILTLMGAVASYPVAALSHGFADERLQRIDALFRFHWVAWYETVAAHPVLQLFGRLAYESVYLSPVILLGWFAWTGRRGEARAFMASFWLAAIVTLVLFFFMPAQGPFATDWRGPVPYMPDSALWQPLLFPALRSHALSVIDLGELRGLVSAPSFHTAAAVLYVRAAWPHRRLRGPLTLVNLLMLIATPVEGTHYLVDMLLGALVAAVALTALEVVAPTGGAAGAWTRSAVMPRRGRV